MAGIVKQRGLYDCGVACLAMALRITYEEALEALGRDPNNEVIEFEGQKHAGVVPEEISWVAFKRGVLTHTVPIYAAFPEGTWQHAWRDVFDVMRLSELANSVCTYAPAYNAILGVPSLNYEDGSHWIYIEDGVVVDPSPFKRYSAGDVLPLQVAVLFGRK
jgi:hypothetical protein